MNEAETKAAYVDPALKNAGWGVVDGSRIRMEFPISKGRLIGNGKRSRPDSADYVLQYRNRNLAVIEAKSNQKSYTEGVGQAKDYAERLQVRFTYSTNRLKIYGIDMQSVLWVTLTGSGYETVSLTGFDGGFEKGSTMYYYKVLADSQLQKHKVGNTYVNPGAGAFTFTYNAVGYTANATVLQVYLEIYSNAGYMQQYGAYGPYAFAGAETTVELFQL